MNPYKIRINSDIVKHRKTMIVVRGANHETLEKTSQGLEGPEGLINTLTVDVQF